VLRLFVLTMVMFFIGTAVFAQGIVVLKGDIIDNMCAGTQSPGQLTDFVKAHTKGCALADQCAASGYAIFADGKLQKFDKESSEQIKFFLDKKDSKLQVVIEAKPSDQGLSLVSIKNQE
jgi:hypothetical protein